MTGANTGAEEARAAQATLQRATARRILEAPVGSQSGAVSTLDLASSDGRGALPVGSRLPACMQSRMPTCLCAPPLPLNTASKGP